MYKILEKEVLSEAEHLRIHEIWNQEYPVVFQRSNLQASIDFTEKWANPKHLVIHNEKDTLIAWLYLFDRDGGRWFSILVDNKAQGLGLGSHLIKHAQSIETEINGWAIDHDNDLKENGEHYRSPIKFYLNHAFRVLENIRWDTDQIKTVKIQWRKNL